VHLTPLDSLSCQGVFMQLEPLYPARKGQQADKSRVGMTDGAHVKGQGREKAHLQRQAAPRPAFMPG
jgi:hypothetical protein